MKRVLDQIALTGHADLAARARSLDEGFAAHLVKPVTVRRAGGAGRPSLRSIAEVSPRLDRGSGQA